MLNKIDWFELRVSARRRYRDSFIYKSWLWVAYRFIPKHRYNILRTGMNPGYSDVGPRVESALAQVLIDYVEKEAYPTTKSIAEVGEAIENEIKMYANLAEEDCPMNFTSNVENLARLKVLYTWCKAAQPALSFTEDVFCKQIDGKWVHDIKAEDEFRKEVDQKMLEIVAIRHFLWT